MPAQQTDRRMAWLLGGLCAGVCLSYLWPVEHVQATATDREERFAICTTETSIGAPESVFVLDFLTGRLLGATLNQQSNVFTNFYARNIAGDFALDGATKPKFVIIPGRADLQSGRGTAASSGVLYVGELNSGKVACYRFSYRNSRTVLPAVPLEPLATFNFREATTE